MRNTFKTLSVAALALATTTFAASAWDLTSYVSNTQTSPAFVTQETNVNIGSVAKNLEVTGIAIGNDFQANLIGDANISTTQSFGADVFSDVNVDVHEVWGKTKIANLAIGSNVDIKTAGNPCDTGDCLGTHYVTIDNDQSFITPPVVNPTPIDPAAVSNINIGTQNGSFELTNLASNNQFKVSSPGAVLDINSNQVAGAITTSTANVNINEALKGVKITSAAIGNSVNISNVFADE
ncbi:hypothetical protein [Maritalea sp.]|uniref:hypothetical protein n=1 Tax=Maritalea sp. TaxID=2003361 RepID=UPI003EF28C34